MKEMLWIIALCGIGTFLLRCLPLWRARHHGSSGHSATAIQKWLAGVGPAAIAALFVVSAWGLLDTDVRSGKVLTVVLALSCVAITRWAYRGGVALPTLAGALAYGALAYVSVC